MQDYAVVCSIMQLEIKRIREFMARKGWGQEELAKKAGVDQSTICRALEGKTIRHSKARHRLALFIEKEERVVPPPPRGGGERVMEAFEKIWDGSDAHAASVAKIIGALAGLRPTARAEKRGRVGQRQSAQKAPKRRRPK